MVFRIGRLLVGFCGLRRPSARKNLQNLIILVQEIFMYKWQQGHFRQIIYGFLIGLCLVMMGVVLSPAQAQISQATVTEILDGNQVFIQGRQANINNIAGAGQQVSTRISRAGLRFNNGAAGRLRSNTSLIIGQCIQIQQGGIVASGPANACIGSVRVATRGTTFVAELDAENNYNLQVLEGSIAVSPTNNPAQNPADLMIRQGEKISITNNGQIGTVAMITVDDILTIINNYFTGFVQQLPGSINLQKALEELFPGVPLPNLRPNPVRGLF
jgi:hypothetical protein